MGYRYRDDLATADAAFDVWTTSPEGLFREAGDALLGVMVEAPEAICPRVVRPFRFEAEALDLLLLEVLQEVVYRKDAERLLLRLSRVEIRETNEGFEAAGEASGEPVDPQRHAFLTDVKAVTLHRLRVVRTNGGWEATVVVDI